MKKNVLKWFNGVGIVLLCIGFWIVLYKKDLLSGTLLISFGYFLYLKND